MHCWTVCCANPNPPQWEGPEYMPFTNLIRHKVVMGISTFDELFEFLFLMPGLRIGNTDGQLGEM